MSRWVITDIHGCFHSFKALLEQQVVLKPQDTLYLLGDYISKGPFSQQVLDYLMELENAGYNLQMLRGNHEQEILNALAGKTSLSILREKGVLTFFRNLGISHPADIPQQYINFFNRLEWYISLEDFLLVHAGFDFQSPEPFAPSDKLVNIRNYAVDPHQTNDRRILHGHSPTDLVQLENSLRENLDLHLSLDAGCAYHKNPKQAHLLALNLNNWQWKTQKNIDNSDNYQP